MSTIRKTTNYAPTGRAKYAYNDQVIKPREPSTRAQVIKNKRKRKLAKASKKRNR